MFTDYVYNVKLQDGTYWSGPRSQTPSGGIGGETRTTGVLSSDKGAELVNTKVDSYNKLTQQPTLPPPDAKTITPPTEKKATFMNPETEQSAIVNVDDYKAGQSLTGQGYQFAEGDYPSWLDDTDEQKAVRDAELEVKEASNKLKTFSTIMANDPALKGLLDSISSQWESRIADMRRVNASRAASIQTTGVRLGSRYTGGAGGMFGGIISEEERQGIARISELEGQKNAALAAAKSAYENEQWDRYTTLVTVAEKNYDKQIKTLEDIQKQQADYDKRIQDALKDEQENYNKYVLSPINDILKTAKKNGAPVDIINSINNAQSVADALNAAESYMQDIPNGGVVGEYLFYKKEAIAAGQVPVDFNTYSDMDANRKRSVSNIFMEGGLNSKQLTALTKINENVSNNAMYKKTNTMQTFVNNTLSALSQRNGVSDIAAINQFQKVIDEGAVTRDQDVKLIQSANSFINKYWNAKKNKFISGDQLTENQRQEMRDIAVKMYQTQIKALQKDPYIIAKNQEAKMYGIDPNDTILGGLDEYGSTADILLEKNKNNPLDLDLNAPQKFGEGGLLGGSNRLGI